MHETCIPYGKNEIWRRPHASLGKDSKWPLSSGVRLTANASIIKDLIMPTKMTSVICHVVALAAWVALVSGCANSHSADLPSPLERSEPHAALAFYEGTWTILDKEHEGYRETCSWLDEVRRHIVCRARVQKADGPRESLGVYSYDQARGEYLYHGFGSRGVIMIERGQRIPNGFHFTSERGAGADRVRTRFTIVEGAQGRVNTVSETSKAEGPWLVDERREYLRTRP
jgi:hypothetical protein